MSGFNAAVALVLDVEAGFQNNPSDNGNWTGGKRGAGELKGTNRGISAASYPDEDIRNMTPERARFLYRRDYWDVVRGDDLPYPIALVTFDAGVNCGIGTAARWLQASLGVTIDGRVGPQTIAAARLAKDPLKTAAAICRRRMLYSMRLGNFDEFGEGWIQRMFDIYREAVEAAA